MNNWDINFFHYTFFEPNYFWMLLIIPLVLVLIYLKGYRNKQKLFISRDFSIAKSQRLNWILFFRYFLDLTSIFIFVLIVAVLAKPYKGETTEDYILDEAYGIDIVLTVDMSESMLAKDFLPNRLEVSKEVMKDFIDQREGDRIGIVAYAGESFTVCSPTTDYAYLKSRLNELSIEKIVSQGVDRGTAIGEGLSTSVLQMQDDSISSKVIILLTDGVNNAGEYSPLAAAELAKDMNISVYPIGVGSKGEALSPISTNFGIQYTMQKVDIDEETLKEIALTTNGKYFRATDERKLYEIYNEINALEKTVKPKIDSRFASEPITPTSFLNWLLLIFTCLVLSRLYFFPFNYHT